MPAKKMRPIKGKTAKKVYEGIRKNTGLSKTSAARIANAGPKAWAKGGKKSKRGPA